MPEPTPLTIWCDRSLPPGSARDLLLQATEQHQLLLPESSEDKNEALAKADIAFGQPDPAVVIASQRLCWVHLTSAGYTRYDRDDIRTALQERGAALTNSSHVYDEPCAQHALAMLLALARQLPECLESQRTDHAWHTRERRARSFLLQDQSVLLLGYGAIAKRLVELLAPFGMSISAVRRSGPQGDEGIPIVAEADLEEALATADHVFNILPDNNATRGYMSAARFVHMKPGACFYNIGRGTTVDQDALLATLQSGRLAAAYLDVTDPEPLPPTHSLWTAPNCFITPHSAGGHANEEERLVRHFLSNLAAFERGEALADRVF